MISVRKGEASALSGKKNDERPVMLILKKAFPPRINTDGHGFLRTLKLSSHTRKVMSSQMKTLFFIRVPFSYGLGIFRKSPLAPLFQRGNSPSLWQREVRRDFLMIQLSITEGIHPCLSCIHLWFNCRL
jgi:hypothetical protein